MGNETAPLVSIIITTYNRVQLLERAVKSALDQNYKNLEVVISDNMSSDNTSEVATQWALQDSRVKYFKNEINLGSAGNHQKAILDYAKGDWVVYVSDDDYLCDENFVSDGMKMIIENGGDDIAFYQSGVNVYYVEKDEMIASMPVIKENEMVLAPTDYFFNYFKILFFSFTTSILNRKQILEQNLVKSRYRLDVELLLVMSLTKKSILSKRLCGVYTIHNSQNYASGSFRNYIEILDCYINSAEFAANNTGIAKEDIKKWVKEAQRYYYLNVVGWLSNILQQKKSNPFLTIKRGLFYKVLLKLNLYQKKTNYLWIYYRPLNPNEYAVFQIYVKGILYDIFWYIYSNNKIRRLFSTFKSK